MTATVSIRDGGVYIPAATAATYFAGVDAVILLVRDSRLMVLPVRGANAGGCLLKRLNLAGDRLARSPDAFAAAGLATLDARDVPAEWDSSQFALSVPLA